MDWLQFTSSIAGSLAWPIIVLVLVLAFRTEVRAILRRVRKGKLAGAEFELEDVGASIASEIETRVESPKAVELAGTAHGSSHAAGTLTVDRTAADSINAIEESIAVTTMNRSFTADAVLATLARATTPKELASRVTDYVELRSAPPLRRLSPERRDLEERLFRAILDLQSLRAEGARPADPSQLSTAVSMIRTFWTNPEALSDTTVDDLRDLIGIVMGEMIPSSDDR